LTKIQFCAIALRFIVVQSFLITVAIMNLTPGHLGFADGDGGAIEHDATRHQARTAR
jgi:hypothetical protein